MMKTPTTPRTTSNTKKMSKKAIVISALAGTLLLGGAYGAGWIGSGQAEAASNSVSQNEKQRIGAEQAVQKALAAFNGTVEGVELERKGTSLYYEVDIENSQGQERDVLVDAYTGKVLKIRIDDDYDKGISRQSGQSTQSPSSTNKQSSSSTVINEQRATDIALKQVNGSRVLELELDRERGKLVYEIEVRISGGTADVVIDAGTGKVLHVDKDWDDDDDNHDDDYNDYDFD
ncbi:PepSY domain-containing protein [Paenibacillus massiliensis]|uniref:PepSY domain-containing protein n=1 Tax=Paenibacillus massiliensis TaxID=225917 RepID=UPI00040CA559|nr:PepSY domain-containing protein [Paenibacillus massiliensis]